MDNDQWYVHMHDGEQVIYQDSCPECIAAGTEKEDSDNGD